MSNATLTWRRLHDCLQTDRPLNRLLWQLYKLGWGLVMVGVVALCYFSASSFTAHRSTDLSLSLDRWIPFLPWTWWIYFPGYLACLATALLSIRTPAVLYRSLWTVLLAQTVCTAVFLVLPSTYPRPLDAGGGLSGDALRWFWQLDPPNNTFPSCHVALSLVAALGAWSDRHGQPLWRWLSTAFAFGVVITVHTTKQHYLVDAVAGSLVAWASWWGVFVARDRLRRASGPAPLVRPTA